MSAARIGGPPRVRAVLFAVLVFSGMLGATEYRVSTPAQILSAMSSAKPGDTLTMTTGVWTNAAIVFQGKGTAEAPILLRAESYGGVVLSGLSNLRISGKHLVVDGLMFRNGWSPSGAVIEFRGSAGESDSCRLTNSAIYSYSQPDSTKDDKWVSLYGTHNRVDHCYFRGKTNSGTTLVVWLSNRPNYHLIDHNYFANRPELYGWNGGETIRVGTSDWSMYDSFTTVEYNLFEECNGEIEAISNKSCGNVYRYNTFVSCQATLTLRHGNRCTVEGNFFFGNGVPNSGGIRIIGEDHKVFNNYITGMVGTSLKSALTIMNGVPNSPLDRYFQVKRAYVVHNTLVGNAQNFNIGGGKSSELTLPPLDCIVANNIVQGTKSPLITLTDVPINMTWQGNIFYGASLGMSQPAGITMVNPQLALSADGLWRPSVSSPAVDGVDSTFPFVSVDIDGQARIGKADIGADEYSSGNIVHRPLTRNDVGPPPIMITGIADEGRESALVRRNFRLSPNYPNPFNPTTNIEFQVQSYGFVVLTVVDVLGREIETLVREYRHPGFYTVRWNASGLPSGVYFCRMQCLDQLITIKMILTK